MDSGTSTYVMYMHFYKQLPCQKQKNIEPPDTHLISFVSYGVWPECTITLPLMLVDYNKGRNNTQDIRFIVINATLPYDVIFERSLIHKFRFIVSTIHGVVKFYTLSGVNTIPTKRKIGIT